MGNFFYREENSSIPNATQDRRMEIEELARLRRAETSRNTALAANAHDITKENQQLLRRIFKKLDPTVAKADSDIQGEIQVSLKYDFIKELLLVKIIKCRDLGLNSISGKTAEPFIMITLYPDHEKSGSKQTQSSLKSQNPVYNEIFTFPMNEVSLSDCVLIIKVLDQDTLDECEFLGETIVNLADFDFHNEPVHTAWYSLVPETDLTITGELEISLGYTLPQTLSVTIHHATELKCDPDSGKCYPFVKVGIPGIEEVFLTEVRAGDTAPVWEETFSFLVPKEEFGFRYIVLTVTDSEASDSLLGHVVIDLDNFDAEEGFRSVFPLSDMSHNDRLKNKWFQSTTVQEFKEALWAHSFFHYPKLMFQPHKGNKIVRLSCPRAGAKAKLSLINGIPIV